MPGAERIGKSTRVVAAVVSIISISIFLVLQQQLLPPTAHLLHGPDAPPGHLWRPLVVVSAGGSGSSYVMSTLRQTFPKLPMNDVDDRDGVKHEMPCRLANLLSGSCGSVSFTTSRAFCPRGFRGTVAPAVLYILGDPGRSIASIRRRGLARYLSNRMRPCSAATDLNASGRADDEDESLLRRMVGHACAWAGLKRATPLDERTPSGYTAFATVAHLASSPAWLPQFMQLARIGGVGGVSSNWPVFEESPRHRDSFEHHLRADITTRARPLTDEHDVTAKLTRLNGCVVGVEDVWSSEQCMLDAQSLCEVETR